MSGIRHVYDVQLPGRGGGSLAVDLHFTGSADEHPVLLWFHGGGWTRGGRRASEEKILWPYARAGLTVVSVGYRLSGEANHPAQLDDAFDALAWLSDPESGYSFDTSRVFVGGGSAGGHIASLVGVNLRRYRRRHGDALPPVRGVIVIYPVANPLEYDAAKLAAGPPAPGTFAAWSLESTGGRPAQFGQALLGPDPVLSPSPFLDSYRELVPTDVPPYLIQHGSNDTDVPFSQSLLLYDTLSSQGVPTTLVLHSDADHGSPWFHRGLALDAVSAFVREHSAPPS
ncbi:alpha/beta hydrolase [Leucobacter weissii]|uniref:Alpha/beta hydrolase n=1 Tax=Leucobacter weissii TaxID=1983706 RepID=A0A939MIW9_9MICO|nr:alpha/beta hydrolase [Leucobacter weissii]MBO1901773.1 alpha/beta hydrolase [Leucobacter weissii]